MGFLSPATKQPVRIADHKNPCSSEVKNDCNCTSAQSYAFTACTGSTLLLSYLNHKMICGCRPVMETADRIKKLMLFGDPRSHGTPSMRTLLQGLITQDTTLVLTVVDGYTLQFAPLLVFIR